MTLLASAPAAAQGILIVGDSISAAFGLELERGWVSLLKARLHEHSYVLPVVNASVSGDTTAGGLARLPRLLEVHQPDLVVIELGGNDGLRGLAPDKMQQNLSAMIDAALAADADVLLMGMRIPPNYGVRYTEAFEQVYRDLGSEPQVTLVTGFIPTPRVNRGFWKMPGRLLATGLLSSPELSILEGERCGWKCALDCQALVYRRTG